MSRRRGFLDTAVKVVFLALLGLLTLALQFLFLIIFIPIIGWYIWSLSDRNAELERKLSELQNPAPKKPET
jgi:4-amino-4-deoxy-L-arabinose transferase-like glycosyltransferase